MKIIVIIAINLFTPRCQIYADLSCRNVKHFQSRTRVYMIACHISSHIACHSFALKRECDKCKKWRIVQWKSNRIFGRPCARTHSHPNCSSHGCSNNVRVYANALLARNAFTKISYENLKDREYSRRCVSVRRAWKSRNNAEAFNLPNVRRRIYTQCRRPQETRTRKTALISRIPRTSQSRPLARGSLFPGEVSSLIIEPTD